MRRGETGSGALALTPVQWVRRHAPSTRAGGSAQVVAVAQAFAVGGRSAVKDAVLSGRLPVRSAAVVVSEADKLAPLLADGVEPTVVDGLVEVAVEHGPSACRMLRARLLADYGRDGELQREQDAAKRFVSLSRPHVDELGLAEYRLTLDPEGRAVLEAALGPLSAPQPLDGDRDSPPASPASSSWRPSPWAWSTRSASAGAATSRAGCSSSSSTRRRSSTRCSSPARRRSPRAARSRSVGEVNVLWSQWFLAYLPCDIIVDVRRLAAGAVAVSARDATAARRRRLPPRRAAQDGAVVDDGDQVARC